MGPGVGHPGSERTARGMISQFFEVQIRDGQADRYLGFAAALKPELDAMGGCLFIDRFKSLSRENLLLSYQIWQDEASMTAWRVDPQHHVVQEAGRNEVFADYRIRIAQVLHEERPSGSSWTPERLSPYNDPTRRPPTFVVASESLSRDVPIEAGARTDVFESVYRPGVFAHLFDVASSDEGVVLGRRLLADPTTEYFRVFEVMRDYGMFDRSEAPQYYPPAPAPGRDG